MLRIVIHALVAAGLAAALVAAWNHAHEPAGSDGAVVVLQGSPPLVAPPEAVRVQLGDSGQADALHLRFKLRAEGLTPGAEIWQDGRLHLEWHRDGRRIERIFLASVRGNETCTEASAILPGIPHDAKAELHLEHLGENGCLRLDYLEAFPTRDVPLTGAGLGLIAMGWIAWVASVAGSLRRLRSWLAALVWVAAAYLLVVPGPWTHLSPLAGEFALDGPPSPVLELKPEDFSPAACEPGTTESPNLLLRWKLRLHVLRPLLHGLLFFVPAFALLLLLPSRKRAIGLAALLALAVELAQWAFGYGFEGADVIDLATDAAGIGAAWLVFRARSRAKTAGIRS